MPISDVRLNLGHGRSTQETALESPGVTFIARFEPPMQVEILTNREAAKAVILADVTGYSLAEWCIGTDGEQGFVSVDKLRVRDSNYLPAATPRT